MTTRTPNRPEDKEFHGEKQPEPIFGPDYDENAPLGNPTDPRSNDTAAGDPSDPRGGSSDAGPLRRAEESPSSPASAKLGDKEKGMTAGHGRIGSGFKTGDKFMPLPMRVGSAVGGLFKTKKGRAGIVGGSISGIALLLFSIVQGPLQVVHLSQILQKNFFGSEKTNSSRTKGLFRYAKAGDVGETRVTFRGSERFANVMKDLKSKGIDFSDRNRVTGRPNSVKFDSTKHTATKGLKASQARTALANFYEVPERSLRIASRLPGGGAIFEIDTKGAGKNQINLLNRLISKSLLTIEDGRIATALNQRVLKIFFKLPRLFHPLTKKLDAGQRVANYLDTKASRKKAEKERLKKRKGPTTQKITAAKNKIKNKVNSNRGKLAGFLVATAGTCIARSVASSIPVANRAAVVTPAVIEATDKQAAGSQDKSGDDFDIGQLGAIVESFEDDKGQTIWQAKALQATADNQNFGGQDLDVQYKQAFYNKDAEQEIKDKFDVKLFGFGLASIACSKPGILAQAIAGAGLILASCGSVVACAPAILKAGAGAVASAAVLAILTDKFLDLLSEDAVQEFAGPVGGNLMAYGAREAANIGARSMGGSRLSASQTAALERKQREEEQKDFKSKSFFARMFDVHDYRSLASKTIDSASTDPARNVASLLGNLSNVGSLITNIFSSLIPQAKAASSYNWGFPRYGIPLSVTENTKYDNPYDNAERAVGIFKSDRSYIKRAKTCFGVTIEKDNGGKWTATVNEDGDVNPASHEYHMANCGDTSENWRRIQLFVWDTRLMGSIDCYFGGSESCQEIGVEDTGVSSSTASGSISGTAQELAQRVVDNGNIIKSGRYVLEDLQNTADGKPAYGSTKLDIGILQFLLEASKHGNVTVTSITGEGSGHSPGSNHYSGNAVDLGCTGVGNQVELLNKIAAKYKGKNNGERCDRPNPYGYDPHDHYDFSN